VKISVITICRDAGAGLQRAVASVLGQSRPPDDYLIQDGGSSDGSVARLVDWLRANYESHGHPVHEDTTGAASSVSAEALPGFPGEFFLESGKLAA
jgi:glycosyltransferase involved in cell wall biosynthesis